MTITENSQNLISIVKRTDIYETTLNYKNEVKLKKHSFNKSIYLRNSQGVENLIIYPEIINSKTIKTHIELVNKVLNSTIERGEPVIDTAMREFNDIVNYSPGYVPNKLGEIVDKLNPILILPTIYLNEANRRAKRDLRTIYIYKRKMDYISKSKRKYL